MSGGAAEEVRLVAFGSCRKQSLAAPVWDAVVGLKPDAWIWTGDAVYPRGNASPEELRAAYRAVAADDERVRRAVRVYDGVYDDHDFGLNDAGSAFFGREASRQAFLDEIVRCPANSVRRTQSNGLYTALTLGRAPREVKVVMLDTRFSRDDHAIPSVGGSSWIPKPGYVAAAIRLASAALGIGSAHEGDVLGAEQWEWLRSELTNSSAAVHIIVSSIQVCATECMSCPDAGELRRPCTASYSHEADAKLGSGPPLAWQLACLSGHCGWPSFLWGS
eukprot:scaffold122034_cov32-Tisochrysis_lutea.AAC.5